MCRALITRRWASYLLRRRASNKCPYSLPKVRVFNVRLIDLRIIVRGMCNLSSILVHRYTVVAFSNLWHNRDMTKETKNIRVYPKEHGILYRLAFRKKMTIAEVIELLVKDARKAK